MERNGEIAIVIGHVPPGAPGDDACLYEWAVRYRALMERF
jgi:hypothetical protein